MTNLEYKITNETLCREYALLPNYIQSQLQDHANQLLHFGPLLQGLRTPEQVCERARGDNFIRPYHPRVYTDELESVRKSVEMYSSHLNTLISEANKMVAEGQIDITRMREINNRIYFLLYGKQRK